MQQFFITFLLALLGLSAPQGLFGQPDLREKILVQLSREAYLSGEIMPFQVQVVDAVFQRESRLSKLAYLDLWNQAGELVQQLAIPLMEGKGEGAMILDRRLPSGYYQLTAYTQWMLNQPEADAWHQPIALLNPGQAMPVAQPGGKPAFRPPVVRFFPEGGSWAGSEHQRVGVLVQDLFSKGLTLSGQVENQRGDSLASFQSNRFGLGSFSLAARPDDAYYLRLFFLEKDSSFRYELPPVDPQRVATRMDRFQPGNLSLNFESSPSQSGQYWLSLRRGDAALSQRVPLLIKDGKGRVVFPEKSLPAGLFRMELRDQQERLLSQRYVWLRPATGLKLEAKLSDRKVTPRDSVRVEVSLKDEKGAPVEEILGISVARKVPVPGYPLSTQLTEPGTRALIQHLDPSMPAWENLDSVSQALILLCQSPPGAGREAAAELPEIWGQTMQGSVVNEAGESVSGARVCLSLVGKVPFVRYTQTDAEGRFTLILPPLYGVREVVAFAEDQQGRPLQLKLAPFPTRKPRWLASQPLMIPDSDQAAWQQLRLDQQVQGAFATFPRLTELQNQPGLRPFFIAPEKSWELKDYTRFALEETFTEIVYPVNLRRKGGRTTINMYNSYTDEVMPGTPLILVDGIPFSSIPALLKLPSRSLERIDAVTTRYSLNGEIWDGVLHIVTNDGKGKALTLPRHYQRFPWLFLSTPLDNQAPLLQDLPKETEHQAFFQPLLFWDTDVQTNQAGKAAVSFSASDAPGKYEIRIWVRDQAGNTRAVSRELVVEP